MISTLFSSPMKTENERKARYGVAYMRALASQAGLTFVEESADEDVQSIDARLGFSASDVRVQLKTTSQFSLNSTNSIGYTAKPTWIRNWEPIKVPIYFVVVVVPDDHSHWIDHNAAGTVLTKAAAYWTLIDVPALKVNPRIAVSRTNRLGLGTFSHWETEMLSRFI